MDSKFKQMLKDKALTYLNKISKIYIQDFSQDMKITKLSFEARNPDNWEELYEVSIEGVNVRIAEKKEEFFTIQPPVEEQNEG